MSRSFLLLGLLPLTLLACDPGPTVDAADDGNTDETDAGSDTDNNGDDTDLDTDTGGDTGTSNITWPASAEDYVYDDVTYLSGFRIPGTASPCCRDWGAMSKDNVVAGSNKIDNALAGLASLLGPFGIDVQDQLDYTVESGAFVGLVEHHDHPVGDGTYNMAFFMGAFEGITDFDRASGGLGTFTVLPESFVGGSGEPAVVFRRATVSGGHLTASGGHFEISLPLLDGVTLTAPVDDVTIEADVDTTGGGIALTSGELSGYITQDSIFTAYNDLVNTQCACLGLTGDIFTQGAGGDWSQHCVADAADLCLGFDEEICVAMGGTKLAEGGYCSTLFGFMPLLSDIDTDADPSKYEALSVGLRMQGVPGTVVGLTPAP